MSAVELKNVNFSYKNSDKCLRDINLSVAEGECILLTGPSGCGKTTLLRVLNGLAPHYFPGEISGEITELDECVNGREIQDFSEHVGTVFQNPRSQFFCVDTESELAFACENRGMEEWIIRQRIADTVNRFSLEDLIGKSLFAMSGGQKQQVACASVDVSGPEIILLDEPSANLDYQATKLLARTISIWKKQKKTILIADHRTAYLKGIVDRTVVMEDGRIAEIYGAREFDELSDEERVRLKLRSGKFEDPEKIVTAEVIKADTDGTADNVSGNIEVHGLVFSFRQKLFGKRSKTDTLVFADMSFEKGKITAIVGRNGVGKTTFLRCFCGLTKEADGEILINGQRQKARMRLNNIFLVMQDVNHQLFADSVREEIQLSLPKGMDKDRTAEIDGILDEMDLKEFADRHPMSLSGGQKQRVAIACAIAGGREILLFDEPTSGLDHSHMKQAAEVFRHLKNAGKTILIVTHDAELIHECCDRVVRLQTV